MEPMEQNADFKEDARAWARIHYQNKDGEFEGRMEIVPELSRILFSGPENVDAKEDPLGRRSGARSSGDHNASWMKPTRRPSERPSRKARAAERGCRTRANGTGRPQWCIVVIMHLSRSSSTSWRWTTSHFPGMSTVQSAVLRSSWSETLLLAHTRESPCFRSQMWRWPAKRPQRQPGPRWLLQRPPKPGAETPDGVLGASRNRPL